MRIYKIEVWKDWETYVYISERKPTEKELEELRKKHGDVKKVYVDEIDVKGITYLTNYDECP